MGLRRRLVGEVEGLRVVFAGEVDHFLARHLVAPELGLAADFDVFEPDHAPSLADARRLARAVAAAARMRHRPG